MKKPIPEKLGIEHRSLRLLASPETVDTASRTMEFSFSSETPIDRWFGSEILQCQPESVRLDRLNDGAPLLFNHEIDDLLGVIESGWIGEDRKAYCKVRFAKDERGEWAMQQAQDNILRNVSVGYRIYKFLVDEQADTYTAVDWEPVEISLVTVPADASVGIGRSNPGDAYPVAIEYLNRSLPAMSDDTNVTTTPAPVQAPSVRSEDIINSERSRVTGINNLCKLHNIADDQRAQFVDTGMSLDKVRGAILDIVETRSRQHPGTDATHLDLSPGDLRNYSLFRAIRACVERDWRKAGLELECTRTIQDKLGREARGFFVPYDWQIASQSQLGGVRMNVLNDAAGGYLVGRDHLGGSFIDNLRAQTVLIRAGARLLDGLVGDVDIPKKTGSGTFYWVTDDADVTSSNLTLGSINLMPRTVGGAVPLSRKLLKQSSPSAEMIVRDDLVMGAALAIDLAGLSGTGGAQPLGITLTTGINTQAVSSDAAPTFAEMVAFETELAKDNALVGSLAYVSTPAIKGALKTTSTDTGSGIFVCQNDMVNGYPILTSSQLATNTIIFGNFSDVIIGMWGVLDVKPDEATKAASGGLVLRVFQDVDIAVRHPESFCLGT